MLFFRCPGLLLLRLAGPEALRSVSQHEEGSHLQKEAAAADETALAALGAKSHLLEEAVARGAIAAVGALLERHPSAAVFAEGGARREPPVVGPDVSVPTEGAQLAFVSVGLLSLLLCFCGCLALFVRSPSGRCPPRSPPGAPGRLSLDRPSAWRWSDAQLPPLPESGQESEQACSSSEGDGLPPPAVLCPQLLVPSGTRLDCAVGYHLCRKRQNKTFTVCGLTGVQLFQVRAEERVSDDPGIYMETLGRAERLAFLSTEELWSGVSSPQMFMFNALGSKYGVLRKTEEGTFEVCTLGREGVLNPVLTYMGDFAGRSYKVVGRGGRTIALVSPSSGGEKKLVVHSRNDAGLVILGILAVDKYERPADGSPSDHTSGSAM